MRLPIVILLAVFLSACNGREPTLAGGKPVSYWVHALKDPDAKLRKKAAFKLGNVGSTDGAVLPALIGALKDADAQVRCEVILSLLKFGPDAKESVPTLTKMRDQDPNAKVRLYAAKALEKLDRDK